MPNNPDLLSGAGGPDRYAALVQALRAAGCVFAEDEASLLLEATGSMAELESALRRRVTGEPLELILGWVEFCGLRLRVAPGVFVPRQRTAVVVERALGLARPGARVLDLCCGVGAIGAALAARVPGLSVLATDLDPAAVECAEANLAECSGQVFTGDLFDALPSGTARFDLIVVNAPYVPTEAIGLMPPEARDWEPRMALDGGSDGLDVHRRIFAGAADWLVPGGRLLIESSADQAPESARLAAAAGLDTEISSDDERDATVVIATRPSLTEGVRTPTGWDDDQPEVPLLGGDVTVGVVRTGSTVRRPLGPNSAAIHAMLEHLQAVGFDGAPRFLGVDRAGREVLTFLAGEVAGRPRPAWIGDEARLRSVARLLRRFDDAAATFVLPAGLVPDWGVPDIDLPALPPEAEMVIGHQDITPENVVFSPTGEAIALIDFDLMKPCSRLAEVINALIWWAPLADPADRDPQLREVDVPRRCRIFADAYGLSEPDRHALVDSALLRTRRSWLLMRHRAETDGGGWARMWEEGIGEVINRRHAWLSTRQLAITEALLRPAPG